MAGAPSLRLLSAAEEAQEFLTPEQIARVRAHRHGSRPRANTRSRYIQCNAVTQSINEQYQAAIKKAQVPPSISVASSDAGADAAPPTPRRAARKVTTQLRRWALVRAGLGVTTRAMTRAAAQLQDVVAVPATQDGWRSAGSACDEHQAAAAGPCLRETPPLVHRRAANGLAGSDAVYSTGSATYETPASPDMAAALESTERAAESYGDGAELVGSVAQPLDNGDASHRDDSTTPYSDGFDAARLASLDAARYDIFYTARLDGLYALPIDSPLARQIDSFVDSFDAQLPDLEPLGGLENPLLDGLDDPLLDGLDSPLLGEDGARRDNNGACRLGGNSALQRDGALDARPAVIPATTAPAAALYPDSVEGRSCAALEPRAAASRPPFSSLGSRLAREADSLPSTMEMDLGRAGGDTRAVTPRRRRAAAKAQSTRLAALAAHALGRPSPSPRARAALALEGKRLGSAGVMVRWQEIVACLRAGTTAPSEYTETAMQTLRADATVDECAVVMTAQLQMLRGAVADGAIAKLRECWLRARIYHTELALARAPRAWVTPTHDTPLLPLLPGAQRSRETPGTEPGSERAVVDRRCRLSGHKWAIIEEELGVGVLGLFVTDGREGAAAIWHVDSASLDGVRAWCRAVREAQPATVALGAALAWAVEAAVRGSRLTDVGVLPLETARGGELEMVSDTHAAVLVARSRAS